MDLQNLGAGLYTCFRGSIGPLTSLLAATEPVSKSRSSGAGDLSKTISTIITQTTLKLHVLFVTKCFGCVN